MGDITTALDALLDNATARAELAEDEPALRALGEDLRRAVTALRAQLASSEEQRHQQAKEDRERVEGLLAQRDDLQRRNTELVEARRAVEAERDEAQQAAAERAAARDGLVQVEERLRADFSAARAERDAALARVEGLEQEKEEALTEVREWAEEATALATRLHDWVDGEKPLDKERTLSCGHTYTLRHVACPACFADLKVERALSLAALRGLPVLDGALREWVAAHDTERAAARAAAKARHNAFAGMPTRIPRNAIVVLDSQLSPEERARAGEECRRFMAPISEAERLHKAARERLAKALVTARAALAGEGEGTKP